MVVRAITLFMNLPAILCNNSLSAEKFNKGYHIIAATRRFHHNSDASIGIHMGSLVAASCYKYLLKSSLLLQGFTNIIVENDYMPGIGMV